MYEIVYHKGKYEVRKRSNGRTLVRGTLQACQAYVIAKTGTINAMPTTYTCYSRYGKNIMGFLK